ncbi:uncharacterized protein [Haliotis cracherodii]|uniref:uncharacterized protein n=1 Tax=Haliotis cracherodii TaxID=6455 RepID=UPI0039E784EF
MKTIALLVALSLVSGDHLDNIKKRMDAVNETNCHHLYSNDLQLPHSVVTHIPVYEDGAREMFANRSLAMEAYKMTLNRGFFFSIIYQKLNKSRDFEKQPDLVYTYLSAMSDVTSGPDAIVGSGIYYDKNTSYPNFYRTLPFNSTIPLFGAYTNRMQGGIRVEDDSIRNYTRLAIGSTTNTWYSLWLPDWKQGVMPKDVYSINIGDDGNSSTFIFNGPSSILDSFDEMPVWLTNPYFDCGRTNKWVVSVTSPITDYLPRYTPWHHLRRSLYVAESTVEIDFTKFDINPCPYSYGNPRPNYFAGIALCKGTTECQPLSGFGLNHGGYECVCRPGYRYKNDTQTEPFKGVDMEQASLREYMHGFECEKIEEAIIGKRDQHVLTDKDVQQKQRVLNITAGNCHSRSPNDLALPYNVQLLKHFKPQGRVAVRLAHFLSSFLQTQFNPGQDSQLKPQQSLNKDQLFAEVAANVLGDIQIVASDAYIMLSTEEIVSVYVTKKISPSDKHPNDHVVKSSSMTNMTESVFSDEQNVWKTAVSGLRTINAEPWMKIIPNAKTLIQMGTWTYKVPDYEQGKWGAPTFVCDSRVMEWTLKYTIPVFGSSKTESSVKFRGAVSVSVSLPTSLLSDV